MRNPGAVSRSEHRSRYASDFRKHILDLLEEHRDQGLPALAEAMCVPQSTLEDWLAGGREAIADIKAPSMAKLADRHRRTHIATVLEAYSRWKGTFLDFCDHVHFELRIPYTRSFISDLLQAEGLRIPKRRKHTRDDAEALRGLIQTFFPGAQWTADGSPWKVTVAGTTYSINVELVVDMFSAAIVGASLRDQEDAQALIQALTDARKTTGESSLGLLVDNKPGNHTEEVEQELGDTIKIRATTGRPQNKAHVEGGGFGLFSQTAPELVVPSLDPEVVARTVLFLVLLTWIRTLNHRPRASRGGRSRVALYLDGKPSPEEVEKAREHLDDLARKQEEARQRKLAALDPELRAHVDQRLVELGLEDPQGHFRAKMAHYPADAVMAGLATYKGKQDKGTLPDTADIRYLDGIIRNIAAEDEGWAITLRLLEERLAVRDRVLAHLDDKKDKIELEEERLESLLKSYADLAVLSPRHLDQAYWLRVITDLIDEEDDLEEKKRLFKLVARRIWAEYKATKGLRQRLTRRLAVMVFPVV